MKKLFTFCLIAGATAFAAEEPLGVMVLNPSSGTQKAGITGFDYVAGNSGIDASTESLSVVDYEHHEIHGGSHFYVCGFLSGDDGDTNSFAMTTPNSTKEAHLTFTVGGTSQTEFYMYEAATYSNGTPVVALNNNRNSSKTSDVTVVSAPDITTAGSLIYSSSAGYAGTTPAAASAVGVVARDREIVLKTNTVYLINLVSRDDGNVISYCSEWYEHTPKN